MQCDDGFSSKVLRFQQLSMECRFTFSVGVAPDRYERSNQKELFRQRWCCCVQGYTGSVSFAVTNFRCKLSLSLQLASNVGVNGKKRVVFAIEADAAILAQRGQDKKIAIERK
ncbi:hypothetical protein QG37_02680 [Candidozyma auris]|nr:hypothetical protein QG37_02680 [[Candida] auris]